MEFNPDLTYKENDTQCIIEACLRGDARAELMLYNKHLGFAGIIVHRYLTRKQDVDAVINDSFSKIFFNLKSYKNDGEETFKFWFSDILMNTALDLVRKNAKFEKNISIDEMEIGYMDEDILSKIAADEISKVVQKLPLACRSVFILYFMEGYPHKEIALKMGIAEGTSRSHLRDACKKLQIIIKNTYPDLYLTQNFNNNIQ